MGSVEERVFFSEEKNQKTFANWAEPTRISPVQVAKVFCFFFSKKKTFLQAGTTAVFFCGRLFKNASSTLRCAITSSRGTLAIQLVSEMSA